MEVGAVEAEALAVEAGVVEAEESTVEAGALEAEAPAVEAEAPAGALLDGAGIPGSGGRGGGGSGGGGRGGARLGVVEDGALLDRAPARALKQRPEDWCRPGRRTLGRGGGRGTVARVEAGGGHQSLSAAGERWAHGSGAAAVGTRVVTVRI
jgi:hypothetical protein